MNVVPSKIDDRIAFYLNHIAAWTANAVAIGSSTTEISALSTLATAASAARSSQQVTLSLAKDKTLAMDDAFDLLSASGAAVIKKIKGKAATDGNNVYVLASIPAPSAPGPVGAPGTPTDFGVSLDQNGWLTTQWKCANPAGARGTQYQVSRKIGTGTFITLGTTGARKFVDKTLPQGAQGVVYQIIATRSTIAGPAGQFNVNFGVSGSGEAMAEIVSAPRMAA